MTFARGSLQAVLMEFVASGRLLLMTWPMVGPSRFFGGAGSRTGHALGYSGCRACIAAGSTNMNMIIQRVLRDANGSGVAFDGDPFVVFGVFLDHGDSLVDRDGWRVKRSVATRLAVS